MTEYIRSTFAPEGAEGFCFTNEPYPKMMWYSNKGKKMNEAVKPTMSQFLNKEHMEAATMEFKSEGVTSSQDMKGLLDASFEPGDVGATVQTDADINP